MSKAERQALAKGHFIDVLLQSKYWRLDLFKAAELGPADIGLERAALMHLSPNENIQVQSSGAWMEKS